MMALACLAGAVSTVKLLLEQQGSSSSSSSSSTSHSNSNTMAQAAARGLGLVLGVGKKAAKAHVQVARYLLKHGVQCHKSLQPSSGPRSHVNSTCRLELLQVLLESGARWPVGQGLRAAAACGDVSMLCVILERQVGFTDSDVRAAIYAAAESGHAKTVMRHLRSSQLVPDPEPSAEERTLVMAALKNVCLDKDPSARSSVLQELLRWGDVDVHAKLDVMRTPLTYAFKHQDHDMAFGLLSSGADVDGDLDSCSAYPEIDTVVRLSAMHVRVPCLETMSIILAWKQRHVY
jgi:hypothetical protein